MAVKWNVLNVPCTLIAVSLGLALAAGCERPPEVVVYAALDREFSEPILNQFQAETQIRPLAKYDLESTKTVGLTQAIIGEAARPRCDVFWNNEILNTLRLEEQGLLEAYSSPQAKHYPELFRSPTGTWHGFAARARVLIVNTDLVSPEDMPTSIYDLAAPKYHGRVAIAKPLFGTTATHAACLFAELGDDKAKAFFRSLRDNKVHVLGGNKQVAEAVAAGSLAYGLTDTDDAMIEVEKGSHVKIVYPDRKDDQLGTLFIPNTLAIIKGCPHPEEAKKLVDFLLSAEVETALAKCPSAQIPLGDQVTEQPRVETPKTVKAMDIDFAQAVKKWDATAKYIHEQFLAP
jgi:iron(III) transport system substrate-binding protein